ncbi:hypothetical protein LG275_13060 [Chryseomicrobium palamuruense]
MIVIYFLITITILSVAVIISLQLYQYNRRRQERQLQKSTEAWEAYFDTLFKKGSKEFLIMDYSHFKLLESSSELMAFVKAADNSLRVEDPNKELKFIRFIEDNKSNWVKLAQLYSQKNVVSKAYFAYVCERFRLNTTGSYDELTEFMMEYALDPSIYCRENALKALYAFGNSSAISDTFKALSEKGVSHNKKLLTDGLIGFQGNSQELATSLYKNLDTFGPTFQVASIDFFRHSAAHLKHDLIHLIKEDDKNKDFTCSILRYYQKYPVQEYKPILIKYLNSSNEYRWECAATAATTLAHYPGTDTLHALKKGLHSKQWYVRLNSARSIASLQIDQSNLEDVLQGKDFYAKEQLVYHFTSFREKV